MLCERNDQIQYYHRVGRRILTVRATLQYFLQRYTYEQAPGCTDKYKHNNTSSSDIAYVIITSMVQITYNTKTKNRTNGYEALIKKPRYEIIIVIIIMRVPRPFKSSSSDMGYRNEDCRYKTRNIVITYRQVYGNRHRKPRRLAGQNRTQQGGDKINRSLRVESDVGAVKF